MSSLLVLLLLAVPALAGEPTAADVLSKVQAAHQEVAALQVDFSQTSSGPSFFDPLVQTGTFELERPDRIRWTFVAPTARTYISDGKTLWIVEDENKTVQVFGRVDGLVRRYVDLLTGLGDAVGDFDVTLLARAIPERTGLKLKPKLKDDQIAWIELEVDAQHHVVGVVVVSPFGDRTDMQLTNRRTPKDLPDERFTWTETVGWSTVQMTGTTP